MSFEDTRRAIEERFQIGWASASTVKFENVEFIPPKNEAYVSLNVTPGLAKQITLNVTPTYREVGTIVLQIFSPKGKGTSDARKLGDLAASIFRSKEFREGASGRILCFTPSLKVIGVDEGWYQVNVIVPYWRDVTFSD